MSQPNIKQLKASDLSTLELRLQKVQQAIDDLDRVAKRDKTLKRQLDVATSPESFVEIAVRQGYQLTVADIETLRCRTQQQVQLHSDEFDGDELSEQELELVAGGGTAGHVPNSPPVSTPSSTFRPRPNWLFEGSW
jgi:predicted ribosomally synthesized peptide with nif11-like leader